MATPSFRDYLYPPEHPRVAGIRHLDVYGYAEAAKSDPFAGPMIEGWNKLYPQPFTGITSDGTVQRDLFPLAPARAGEEAPVQEMVLAAQKLLGALAPAQRLAVQYPLDSHAWRSWANPEFLQHNTGVRLEELDTGGRDAAAGLLQASLSPAGAGLARDLMRINGFLGELVQLPQLMNEFSYNLALYGQPSLEEPWGWHLFGHHVALNVLVAGTQMVISPVFLGAEPDVIDAGPYAGVQVFKERIELARTLMSGLPAGLQARALSYALPVDPAMPPGRLHPGDERHLAGCFQDNRVIPYEGIRVTQLPAGSRELVRRLLADITGYLPAGPAAARMREILAHEEDTWFSWIGGWSAGDAFYFRLQSPVLVAELDHHCGVFLSNDHPAPFHMHTVVRTPNGNDYGRELVRQATGRGFDRPQL